LAKHVRPGDDDHTPWPFRVYAKTGELLAGEEYGGIVASSLRLFDELREGALLQSRGSKQLRRFRLPYG